MTTPASITAEIQQLSPSARIELFQLDATNLGLDIYYFHSGTNALASNVVWQGQEYVKYPISVTGFELITNSQLPRPKLQVSNVLGTISALLLSGSGKDLQGAKLTRKRTLLKFLDAVNFPGGTNPDADPTAGFEDDVYFVDQKTSENYQMVELELAAALDLQGVQLPGRQIIQNICPWKYRGTECSYTGTTYFDINDNSVPTSGQDICGKRLTSCKLRFGANNQLTFGAFPSSSLLQ